VNADSPPSPEHDAQLAALQSLTTSAAANIPGVDFASITLYSEDGTLRTVAATDQLAEKIDAVQYELREGPCYGAVTEDRFVLVNDMSATTDYPRLAPRVVGLGVWAQAAMQLTHHGRRAAGLNLYARTPGAFDRSTVEIAEMFASHAATLLEYVEQVEHLNEALRTRTDIGTAVGILMERYGIDRHRAFKFLVRSSNNRNTKLRALARDVIDGSFGSTTEEDRASQQWPD